MPHALVIGGSVGGLFAANLLRRIGWEVTVCERAAGDLGDRGTGIGTRDPLFAVLRRGGVPIDTGSGIDVRSRICLDRGGDIAHELPLRSVTSSWARIYRPLKAALPPQCYRAGARLIGIVQDGHSVTASFADGTRLGGDLLIGADGLHSTVRTQFLPSLQPNYAGYVAWRGVADPTTIPPPMHDLLFHHMIFAFPEGSMLLSVPMPGDDGTAGMRACHYVWFQPADDAALADWCTDSTGRRHGRSIPPPLIRPELVRAVKARAAAELDPLLALIIAQMAQPLLQPIYDLESPTIVFGRVALLGDAAFVARPHVATGVMKAALDAQALADALAASDDDIEAALVRYQHERRLAGQALVARGRHIGAQLENHFSARGESDSPARAKRIETVMHEYGAAGRVLAERITAAGIE
jgi:2-polyprenyl-6-methoxyphenol hydroxylase-like FAD-dependent oxidoreductase